MDLSASSSLEERFFRESPRRNPRRVPIISWLIVLTVVTVYFLLLWPTFFRQNIAAWSVGIAYILYDTALLAFTASRIADLKRSKEAKEMFPGKKCSLGVLIAAHNEANVLGL